MHRVMDHTPSRGRTATTQARHVDEGDAHLGGSMRCFPKATAVHLAGCPETDHDRPPPPLFAERWACGAEGAGGTWEGEVAGGCEVGHHQDGFADCIDDLQLGRGLLPVPPQRLLLGHQRAVL
jgi:hypothetical protein